MMSNQVGSFLLFAGAFVVCFLVGLAIRYFHTGGSWKCEYDERQELVRGRGYKYGFITLAVYYALDYMVLNIFEREWAQQHVDILIGILLGIGVYAIYCIMNEAFLSLRENQKRYIITLVFVMICNAAGAAVPLISGESLIEDGRITSNCINLFCALLLTIILFVMALKQTMIKREDD